MLILSYFMIAPSSGSLVDASGYKFSEKDTKPGKIKLKKSVKLGKKKGDGVLPPFYLAFILICGVWEQKLWVVYLLMV